MAPSVKPNFSSKPPFENEPHLRSEHSNALDFSKGSLKVILLHRLWSIYVGVVMFSKFGFWGKLLLILLFCPDKDKTYPLWTSSWDQTTFLLTKLRKKCFYPIKSLFFHCSNWEKFDEKIGGNIKKVVYWLDPMCSFIIPVF